MQVVTLKPIQHYFNYVGKTFLSPLKKGMTLRCTNTQEWKWVSVTSRYWDTKLKIIQSKIENNSLVSNVLKKKNNNKSLLSQKEAAEIPTLKKRKQKATKKSKTHNTPHPHFFGPPFGWGAEDKHHRTLFGNSTSMLPSTGELSRCLFTIF